MNTIDKFLKKKWWSGKSNYEILSRFIFPNGIPNTLMARAMTSFLTVWQLRHRRYIWFVTITQPRRCIVVVTYFSFILVLMYFIFIIFQGFFRRSIQQKIQYRPCTKNQQCNILRINRNRCQYCRLKKCIAAGMSRDGKYFSIIYKIIVHCSKIRKMVQ